MKYFGNETFIVLFLFWIGKPNMLQVFWPQWSIFLFLDRPALKLRINIIILPTAPTDSK